MASEIVEPSDPRVAAFCSRNGPEVFSSVTHPHNIWQDDPFDVDIIHYQARSVFQSLVNRATASPASPSGPIMLLLGEAGSGKSHLMRAFRNYVQSRGLGYLGYMQMTTRTDNYPRYILRKLIDSLSHPYYVPSQLASGLSRLSNALTNTSAVRGDDKFTDGKNVPVLTALRDSKRPSPRLNSLVKDLGEAILEEPRFRNTPIDIDLISALLYLQTDSAIIKNVVMKYLNGNDLSPEHQSQLGGITPKTKEEDPEFALQDIGRLISTTDSNCLVVCVDQLEDIYNLDNAKQRFRLAMGALNALAGNVPSCIAVIACLEDYYTQLREDLPGPLQDKIERDPDKIVLKGYRTEEEIHLLVECRLRCLFESMAVPFDSNEPTFPIPASFLARLTGERTRDILYECHRFQQKAMELGGIPEHLGPSEIIPGGETTTERGRELINALELDWNDLLTQGSFLPSADAQTLAKVLGKAITLSAPEINAQLNFMCKVTGPDVEVNADNEVLLIGICNKGAQGGGLLREVRSLSARANDRRIVIARTTDFPKSPKAQTSIEVGDLIAKGARRTVVEDSDWRAMMAFPEFKNIHGSKPEFGEWQKTERPLTRLPSIRAILALDEPGYGHPETATAGPPDRTEEPGPTRTEPVAVQTPATEPAAVGPGETPKEKPVRAETADILAGASEDRASKSVTLTPKELTQHAAFLGASGSGKTTVALAIIEQLLLRGIPAILVDRKGDLCCYADDDAWSAPLDNPEQEARRERLRASLDVALFTPGASGGRPLLISIVPEGMKEAQDTEREQVAKYAAAAICGMMGYRGKGQDLSRQAILQQAINLLSTELPSDQITLERIVTIIDDEDPGLVNLIGRLDTRLFKRLVNDLETLRINKADLLQGQGERLDVEALLGVGRFERQGKTRLSIISTRFLADPRDAEFWVAQLLIAVGRWIGKAPKSDLQAVVMFDEADLYLPAIRNPATKEPMENLLKRARSAGLGLFLATQSPGDFDYKCRDTIRTWFLGRVKEDTALKKMRPMLSECPAGVSERLPGQGVGQFHLVREKSAERIKTFPSLIKPIQLPEERILELARSG